MGGHKHIYILGENDTNHGCIFGSLSK